MNNQQDNSMPTGALAQNYIAEASVVRWNPSDLSTELSVEGYAALADLDELRHERDAALAQVEMMRGAMLAARRGLTMAAVNDRPLFDTIDTALSAAPTEAR